MTREEYHIIKNYIKNSCVDTARELCDNVGLNDYETRLIMFINQNESRVAISFKLGTCESKISKDLRKIFTKIYDYLKRQD